MVEAVLNKAVPLAIAQVADRALDESEKIETDVEQMAKIFNGPACEPTSDMEFCIGVDLVPEVTWTGNYKDIAVTVEAAGNDTSAANEVARRLAAKHKELSKMGVVADRGLQRGDVAVLDLSAVKLNEDGSEGDEINGVNNKNFRFDTGEGEGFIPGLVEAVVGMTTGETKTFELTFPAAWYIPSMQGVTGKFTATLKELFAYEFAPLDDDLAPQLMDGWVSLSPPV
jgi:trigger factor